MSESDLRRKKLAHQVTMISSEETTINRTVLDAAREMAGGTSRKTDRIRPFPGLNTPAKVLRPPLKRNRNQSASKEMTLLILRCICGSSELDG